MHFTGIVFHSFIKNQCRFFGAAAGGTGTGQYCSGKKGVPVLFGTVGVIDEGSAGGSIYYCDADLVRFAECGGYDWIYGCISNGLQAVLEGACAADTKLLEMAAVFDLSPVKNGALYLCAADMPFLKAAVKTAQAGAGKRECLRR